MKQNYQQKREKMIERQLKKRGITSREIIRAFRQVPRHEFVPEENRSQAYADRPLPIGENQTISQPYIVAYMIKNIFPSAGDTVLEIGSGCGYVLALLAHLAGEVYGIERRKSLVDMSRKNLKKLGYDIEVKHGDGSKGWPEKSPFDGIIVSAAAAGIPEQLKQQLDTGGKLIIPVGKEMFHQQLVLIKKTGEENFVRQQLDPVRFVPLVEGKE